MRKNKLSKELSEAMDYTVQVVNACNIVPKKIRSVEEFSMIDGEHEILVGYDGHGGDFFAGKKTNELNASCLHIVLDTIMKASREDDAPKEFWEIFKIDKDFVDMVVDERSKNYVLNLSESK